jgi:iron(II)-dependent oxidoreductase
LISTPTVRRITHTQGPIRIDIRWLPQMDESLLGDTLSLAEIPSGPVLIGSNSGYPDQEPCHVVDVPTFAIGRYPITNRQYARFIHATAAPVARYWHDRRFNAPEQPVVGVIWHDALAYTTWLTGELAGLLPPGHVARLPSEIEWEKAAAWDPAHQRARRYPWGNTWNPDCAHTTTTAQSARPNPVGITPTGASAYGIQDMLGNVWEWTASTYASYPGAATPFMEAGSYVIRGGSFRLRPTHLCCTYRCHLPANYWRFHLGVRIVVAPPLERARAITTETVLLVPLRSFP